MTKKEALINELEESILLSKDSRENEDEKNWELFMGVLLSRREAELCLSALKSK